MDAVNNSAFEEELRKLTRKLMDGKSPGSEDLISGIEKKFGIYKFARLQK